MSTPIKPPGAPPAGPGSLDSSGPTEADGAFADAVAAERSAATEQAGASSDASEQATAGAVSSPAETVVNDVRAGRLDVDGAIERLVERALSTTTGLDLEHRQALEAQLREALGEDPTLLALRRELERVSTR